MSFEFSVWSFYTSTSSNDALIPLNFFKEYTGSSHDGSGRAPQFDLLNFNFFPLCSLFAFIQDANMDIMQTNMLHGHPESLDVESRCRVLFSGR